MKITSLTAALALLATVAPIPSPALAACIERVVVFEMQGCPHCAATRAFLETNAIPFERIDVWRDAETQASGEELRPPAVPVITNGRKAVRASPRTAASCCASAEALSSRRRDVVDE
jgi:glutaredoxin